MNSYPVASGWVQHMGNIVIRYKEDGGGGADDGRERLGF